MNRGKRINLGLLVTRMDIGGVPDHIMTLLDGLSDSFACTLICDNIDPVHRDEAERLNVEIVLLPMQRLMGGLSDLKAFRQLHKVIRDHELDILHTHTSKAAMLGAMIGMTSRSVIVVNTGHNFGYIAMQKRWKRAVFWVYDRFISSFGHNATIAVSQTVADLALAGHLIPKKRLHVIQNGIRLHRLDNILASEGLKRDVLGPAMSDGPLLLCVARLVWFKGLHTLIDALPQVMAHHPDARVLIVGDGELRADLEAQAHAIGIADKIVFAGERDDVPALLRIADMFVLPSVSEGLPISLLEAMAAKLPLVASDVGGIPELIDDGRTGALFPREDVVALQDAILGYLGNPTAMRRAGDAGRKKLEDQFSQRAMVNKSEALYHELLGYQTEAVNAHG